MKYIYLFFQFFSLLYAGDNVPSMTGGIYSIEMDVFDICGRSHTAVNIEEFYSFGEPGGITQLSGGNYILQAGYYSQDIWPPGRIVTFNATQGNNIGEISLNWSAPGDDYYTNILGSLNYPATYYIQYTSVLAEAQNPAYWNYINAQIRISTYNVSPAAAQYLTLTALTPGLTYYFRIWTCDGTGNLSEISVGATTFARATVPEAGAFVVYYDSSTALSRRTPMYRGWNNNYFSAEYSLPPVTGSGEGAAGFYRIAACPTRNELMCVLVSADDVETTRVWTYRHDGSTWHARSPYGTLKGPPMTRGTVDVAYEQISGRAIVAYTRGDGGTAQVLRYAIWTGTTWLSEANATGDLGSVIQWVKLYSKPQTNEIIAVVQLANDDIVTVVWDGNSWTPGITLSNSASSSGQQCFDGVYESERKQFMLVASVKQVNAAVQYTIWNSTFWTSPVQFNFGTGGNPLTANTVRWIRLAAHPKTNEILMAVADGDDHGPNIAAAVWNGISWSQNPTPLASHSGAGVSFRPFDVAYEQTSGRGIIVFGDNTLAGTPRYITYTTAAGWSSPASANSIGPTNIRWLSLSALRGSNEIMMACSDSESTPDLNLQRWNGSSWGTVTEIETEMSARESFAASYRFDPYATFDTIPPAAVTDLTGELLGDGKVQLTWSTPGDDGWTGVLPCGSRYLFIYSTAVPTVSELTWPATFSLLISTYGVSSPQRQRYIIANLPFETTWYFRMRTRDEAGNWSGLSNVATFFVLVTPGAITNLSALPGVYGRTIQLTWTAPGDDGYIGQLLPGSKYAIQRSTWVGVVWSTYSVDTVIISTSGVNPGDWQTWILTGLRPGVTYYIRIWTSDELGNWSGISNAATAWATVPILAISLVEPNTYYDFGLLDTNISTVSLRGVVTRNTGNVRLNYSLRIATGPPYTHMYTSTAPWINTFVMYTIIKNVQPPLANFGSTPGNDILTLSNIACSYTNFSDGTHAGVNVEPFRVNPLLSDSTFWFRIDTPTAANAIIPRTIPLFITGEEP